MRINEVEFQKMVDIMERHGWQTFRGRNGTIDMCKKFPELYDVAWMSVDTDRLEKGESLCKVLSESIDEYNAVWGACRVAIAKETTIKGLSEQEAIIKLFGYINAMIDIKAEMTSILKEVKESNIKLV